MQSIFVKILEMSLIGGWCILLVLPVRLLLLRCGRKYAYYLWLAVFLRLLLPFGIQGGFSLIPRQVIEISDMTESETTDQTQKEDVLAGYWNGQTKYADGTQPVLGEEGGRKWTEEPDFFGIDLQKADSHRMRGRLREVSQLVWLIGIVIIVAYNVIHVLMLRRQITPDRWVAYDNKARIAEVEGLSAPFLWGIWRPIIFLPEGLAGEEQRYIIAHESCHRRRKDSIAKAIGFAVTALHWFNPLVWVAWILFCRDMEVSCDEAVVAEAKTDIKKQYASTLLRYAAAQNGYLIAPLTFGEPSVRSRIKNILRFQKKNTVLTGTAGCIAAMVAIGLMMYPSTADDTFSTANLQDVDDQWEDLPGETSASEYETPDSSAEQEDLAKAEEKEGLPEQVSIGAYEASLQESVPYDNSVFDAMPHREGYIEASIRCVAEESIYFSPSKRTQEELDALAQRALRELYDLTGFQIKECVYDCTDLGTFYFANTEENLRHSMDFYSRSFGRMEGYDELCIPSMYIVSARRVWYSDVQQLNLPFNIEQMDEEERAVWFLKNSAIYQGGEVVATESYGEDSVTVRMEDGSFYEIYLDMEIDAVGHIYGPYPEGSMH